MKRPLFLAVAVLVAVPALAQPPSAAPVREMTGEAVNRIVLEQALLSHRVHDVDLPVRGVTADMRAAEATPLPPPCDTPPARDVTAPKPPAPCTPESPKAEPSVADARSPARPPRKPGSTAAPKPH